MVQVRPADAEERDEPAQGGAHVAVLDAEAIRWTRKLEPEMVRGFDLSVQDLRGDQRVPLWERQHGARKRERAQEVADVVLGSSGERDERGCVEEEKRRSPRPFPGTGNVEPDLGVQAPERLAAEEMRDLGTIFGMLSPQQLAVAPFQLFALGAERRPPLVPDEGIVAKPHLESGLARPLAEIVFLPESTAERLFVE